MARIDPKERTNAIVRQLRSSFGDLFTINSEEIITREKGLYASLIIKPSKRVRQALSIDRELLVLVSTFEDQQPRTIQTARDIISESNGRLEANVAMVVHEDPRGNIKLKRWGREQGIQVLTIFPGSKGIPTGDDLLRALTYEMFAHDPFDVTGPVADDANFYGRREEAIELARKLQNSQIRSCFGIRKIGKTSIIHRIIREIRNHHDSLIIFIDASRDSVFSLNAESLIFSISDSIETLSAASGNYAEITPKLHDSGLNSASEKLRSAVQLLEKNLIIVFDEIDYITPGSPTNNKWRGEFNPFWRNIRAVYQGSRLTGVSLSIFVSGVSSKWFSVESIDGVENAALAFVPEEYLSPLPKGAAIAMIKRLGKQAGIIFTDDTASAISESCALMPFWIRKACSFLNGRIEIGLRPYEPQLEMVQEAIRSFLASDGSAMSQVALSHLFRVYPELRQPVLECSQGDRTSVSPVHLRTLSKYGVLKSADNPIIAGDVMSMGLRLTSESAIERQYERSEILDARSDMVLDLGDWADELAILARRRNLIERKLRSIILNFMRYTQMQDASTLSLKDRILRHTDAKRRQELSKIDSDAVMEKLYWLELVQIIKSEWTLFGKIFNDKKAFGENCRIINERPDAHAKSVDLADIALHKRALTWLEERLLKIS